VGGTVSLSMKTLGLAITFTVSHILFIRKFRGKAED